MFVGCTPHVLRSIVTRREFLFFLDIVNVSAHRHGDFEVLGTIGEDRHRKLVIARTFDVQLDREIFVRSRGYRDPTRRVGDTTVWVAETRRSHDLDRLLACVLECDLEFELIALNRLEIEKCGSDCQRIFVFQDRVPPTPRAGGEARRRGDEKEAR